MANFSSIQLVNSAAQPSIRTKANQLYGRVRIMEAVYVAPSSGALPAIGDKIYWGKLPVKARILGHLSRLYWIAGTAGCFLNLGDNIVPARHLPATAITTFGSALCDNSAVINNAVGDCLINSNVITNVKSLGAFQVGASIGGTGIPVGALVTGITGLSGSGIVTLSVNCTVTTVANALTVNSGYYETQDDSNTVAGNYASVTDDATLVSTVSGAQILNSQVITLKMAYAQD